MVAVPKESYPLFIPCCAAVAAYNFEAKKIKKTLARIFAYDSFCAPFRQNERKAEPVEPITGRPDWAQD
jgi:hypothetical protein